MTPYQRNEAIYVGWPHRKGVKRCKACGKFTDGNCFVVRDQGDVYVCNVNCGLKVIVGDEHESCVLNSDHVDIIGVPKNILVSQLPKELQDKVRKSE